MKQLCASFGEEQQGAQLNIYDPGEENVIILCSAPELKTSHTKISSEKARNEFGYESRPFKDTLRDTIEWFKENNYL